MTTIASQLEAALPANEYIESAKRSVADMAIREGWGANMARIHSGADHRVRIAAQAVYDYAAAQSLQLTDQQNARWLAWLLLGIAIGAAMVPFAGWVG